MPEYFFVTDIEADGPNPGKNSMLSFATVAMTLPFKIEGTFSATIRPLPDCQPDPGTVAWFKSVPEAWAAATKDPVEPALAMANFVSWVRSFQGRRNFAAHGLAFDGGWIDHYLSRFTSERLISSLRDVDPLFGGGGICLRSLASGALGWAFSECEYSRYPHNLLGEVSHNHEALNDALGFAHLLANLRQMDRAGFVPHSS
jgi:hypothetical protein